METALPRTWKEQFALAAAMREEDVLHREKMARFAARQRQITEEQRIATQKREAEARATIEAVFASPAQVKAFRVDLDRYDATTVEALMENQEAIDRVRERLDGMLDKAYVLPDGRRVFKTMDGTKVFDEQGQELARDLIDPDLIDDGKPKWEPYRDAKAEDARLVQERQQLHEYQAKLDDARARLDRGEITETELKETKDNLVATMPDAVREKLGIEKLDASVAPAAPPSLDGMDAMMKQTGLGPLPSAGPR